MAAVIIAFAAGVASVQLLPWLPAIETLAGTVLAGAAALIGGRRHAWLSLSGAFVLGFGWAALHGACELSQRPDPRWAGRELEIEGRVASLVDERRNGARFRVAVSGSRPADAIPAGSTVRVNWYHGGPRPAPGERWRLRVRLWPPDGYRNPGGFDFAGWLLREGIDATGYVREAGNRRLARADGWMPVLRARAALDRRLDAALPDTPGGAVVRALAIGDRSHLEPGMWDVLAATGTIHLMAISGLHVGLVAGFAYLLVHWLWARSIRATERVPAPAAGAVAALGAATGYALLAGWSLPTQRALIMLAVAVGAGLIARRLQPVTALLLALALVLALDPLAAGGAGLWLSFAAVGWILYVLRGRARAPSRWASLVRIQVAVSVGLMPLTAVLFERVAWVSIPVNLLAVPVFSLAVVPAVLTGLVLTALAGAPGAALLSASARALDAVWPALTALASVPGNPLYWPAPPLWAVVVAMIGVALALAPRGVPTRGAGVALMGAFLVARSSSPEPGGMRLTLLDVGQGLAAVVRTREHLLIFDTGPDFASGTDTGRLVVLPYLRRLGLAEADAVVLSHGDSDHSGGYRSLAREIEVGRLWMGGGYDARLPGARPCRGGVSWSWDGVRFEFLHPADGTDLAGNDASCVLRASGPGGSVVLTGDLERAGERRLLADGAELDADVLVVPHHGSASSSTPAFVDAVEPRYALVPVASDDRYGLPDDAVLRRYRRAGARLLSTARDGAIRVGLEPDRTSPEIWTWTRARQRWWHGG